MRVDDRAKPVRVPAVVIEPVRSSERKDRSGSSDSVRNDASTIEGWVWEEGAWILGQFGRIALSVAVFRWLHQLFQGGFADEGTYRRAEDLWNHGQEEVSPRPWRAEWRVHPEDLSDEYEEPHDDPGPTRIRPANPKYVGSSEGHHLYAHREILNPETQSWPCPLFYQIPCERCRFRAVDLRGHEHCAAFVKVQAILEGVDGGEDLTEIRDWLEGA